MPKYKDVLLVQEFLLYSWPSYLYNGNPHIWNGYLYIETRSCKLHKSGLNAEIPSAA